MKTWDEWKKIFQEQGYIIMDDDGGRSLYSQGRIDEKISKEEATKLLMICTCMFPQK